MASELPVRVLVSWLAGWLNRRPQVASAVAAAACPLALIDICLALAVIVYELCFSFLRSDRGKIRAHLLQSGQLASSRAKLAANCLAMLLLRRHFCCLQAKTSHVCLGAQTQTPTRLARLAVTLAPGRYVTRAATQASAKDAA